MRSENPRQSTIKGILKKRQLFSHPQGKANSDENFEPQVGSNRGADSLSKHGLIEILSPECNEEQSIYPSPLPMPTPVQQADVNHWVLGGLRIIYYITKFVRQLKNHSTKFKFRLLQKSMLEIIDDSSSDADIFLQRTAYGSKLIGLIKQYLNAVPTIEPDSTFKLFWDVFVLMLILINIFYIPMKLAFEFTKEGILSTLLLETVPSWTFMVDIILTFNTAYYKRGQIHRQKSEIFYHYAKLYLWWDLMIVIPFILSSFNVPYTEYILLLRVTRIKSMIDSLEEAINPKEAIQPLFQLAKAIFFILFVVHFTACLWNLIGELEDQDGQMSWLRQKQIIDKDWQTKYIHSLYFSTITTLTVGYGDIVPSTDLERLYVVMMALVICGVLGYTISSIGNILKSLSEKEELYKQKMMFINRYLKKKSLNKQLQLQVRKYFEYFFKMEQESNEQGEKMMNHLTKNLKEKVQIDIYFNMLMKSRVINKTLSKSSVEKLCQYVHEKKYAPEETIAMQKEIPDRLYFLQQGEAILTCDHNLRETVLAKIQDDKPIGEREFLTQSQYDYSIKASKFSQMAYIFYEDFCKIVAEEPLEEETLCQLKDSLLFNDNHKTFGQVCFICKWTHQFKKCPFVFVDVNYNKLRNQFMISELQPRKWVERQKRRKFTMELIKENAVAQMVNNNILNANELNDSYLGLLGFPNESDPNPMNKSMHTLKSGKSLLAQKTNTSGYFDSQDKFPSQFSMLESGAFNTHTINNNTNNNNTNNQSGSTPQHKRTQFSQMSSHCSSKSKRVKFQQQHQEEQDPRNLRSQNSLQKKVENKRNGVRNQTLTRLSLIPNGRLQFGARALNTDNNNNNNNISYNHISEQIIETMQSNRTIPLQQQMDMVNQLEEEITQNHIMQIINERVDFDIDRQYIATNYFYQNNVETILKKLNKNGNKPKKMTIKNIIRRKKNIPTTNP